MILNVPRLILTVCIFLTVCVPNVYGQTTVKVGLHGGINFANTSTNPSTVSLSSRTGMVIGTHIEIGISNMFSLQPELHFIQKGAVSNIPDTAGGVTSTFKFNYIELPLLFKASFGSSGLRPTVFAGPNLGLNLSAEVEGKNGNQTQTIDAKDVIQSADVGVDLGVGGEYPLDPRTTLMLNVRYSLGLYDINTNALNSWKSRGIQILIGVSSTL